MMRRTVAVIVVIATWLALLAAMLLLFRFILPEKFYGQLGWAVVGSIVALITILDLLNMPIDFIFTHLVSAEQRNNKVIALDHSIQTNENTHFAPSEQRSEIALPQHTIQTRGVMVQKDVHGSVMSGDVKGTQPLVGNTIENLHIHNQAVSKSSTIVSEQQIEEHLPIYRKQLYETVGYTRILGESTPKPLGNIFTDVYLLDKLTAENRFNIEKLGEEYDPREWGWRKNNRLAGMALVQRHKRLFILGKPGAGKTTFLKYIATQALDTTLPYLPLFVTLHEWARSGKSLLAFMADQFFENGGKTAENYLEKLLKAGQAMMLYDGLDELPTGEKREEVIQSVEQLRRQFPDAPLLVTCRIAAESYRFEGFQYVEVADFTEEQVRAFVQRWFDKDEEMQQNCIRALLEDQSYSYLKELAQTPLLLTLICVVYGKHNRFPIERGDIYHQATEALLVSWDSHRRIRRDEPYRNLSLRRKKQMLAKLAAYFFDREQFFIPQIELVRQIELYFQEWVAEADGEAILRAIEAQHGLLVSRSVGIYSFSHLTLQEYYASSYICEHEIRGTLIELMKHVGEPRWNELFLLTAEMTSDGLLFAKHYLEEMITLSKRSKKLTALLQWGMDKDKKNGHFSPICRIFYVFLERAHARSCDFSIDIALEHDRTIALDLDRVLALTLDLAVALAPVHALNLALALDRALARALARDLIRTRDCVLALDLDLGIDLALDYLIWMTTGLVERYPLLKKEDTRRFNQQLSESMAQCLSWATEIGDLATAELLQASPLPMVDSSEEAWKGYAERLRGCLRLRNLDHDWQWSEDEIVLLNHYLQANWLLLACLKVMPPGIRREVEAKLFLVEN